MELVETCDYSNDDEMLREIPMKDIVLHKI